MIQLTGIYYQVKIALIYSPLYEERKAGVFFQQ